MRNCVKVRDAEGKVTKPLTETFATWEQLKKTRLCEQKLRIFPGRIVEGQEAGFVLFTIGILGRYGHAEVVRVTGLGAGCVGRGRDLASGE